MPVPDRDLTDRSEVMLEAARRAGELSLTYFQRADLSVDWKANSTEVTEADREGELLIRSMIEKAFPGDAIVGEEHAARGGESGWTWYIDPIDGTRSFAHGVPLYSVLIGLERSDGGGGGAGAPARLAAQPRSRIVAGIIELPALGERVHATDGEGAWWERTGKPRVPARVSTCDRLDRALLCTTSFDYYKASHRTATLERLQGAVGSIRGWSDAYLFALAATGRIDIAIDPVMHPWDNSPFPVIFREAAGIFSSWKGEDRIDGGDGLAANPALHAQVLRLL
jgi:histidinol-phosphatase